MTAPAWWTQAAARTPAMNLGMPHSMLSKIGNANVGRIPGLPGGAPNKNFQNSMIGLGMGIMNGGFSSQMLPQLLQMLKARRG